MALVVKAATVLTVAVTGLIRFAKKSLLTL